MARYYSSIDASERAFRRLRDPRYGMAASRSYGVMGLGAGDVEAGEVAVTETTTTTPDGASTTTVTTGAPDVVAMQAEIDKLKKENAALKAGMAKYFVGGVVGAVAGYWYRGRRSF